MAVQAARRLLTAAEFTRMAEVGILRDEERLELVHGEIVEMAPIGAPHHACVMVLTTALVRGAGDRAVVSVQGPLQLGPRHVLYPDLALLRPRPDGYRVAVPSAGDTLLVIEVSDTTLDHDRGVKVPLYAEAGIPEVWIVDLAGRHVEVAREPTGGRYRRTERCGPGQRVAPAAFPDLALVVAQMLGR